MNSIEQNLNNVNQRIGSALKEAGSTNNVKLVAVTKNVEIKRIEEAIDLGVKAIGENRVQEAEEKKDKLSKHVEWHMIGHLQTNKAKNAAQIFDWIHSIDSVKIASKLDSACSELNKKMKALIEVNISGEGSKFGIKPENLNELVGHVKGLNSLNLLGLMTMAPYSENPEDARPIFKKLNDLKENIGLQYTSMGMTNDFEIAVQEGANIVRIGTAIFGGNYEH